MYNRSGKTRLNIIEKATKTLTKYNKTFSVSDTDLKFLDSIGEENQVGQSMSLRIALERSRKLSTVINALDNLLSEPLDINSARKLISAIVNDGKEIHVRSD